MQELLFVPSDLLQEAKILPDYFLRSGGYSVEIETVHYYWF